MCDIMLSWFVIGMKYRIYVWDHIFFKEIWTVTRVMQNHYPESTSPRSPRPNLYHGFNICLHIPVCVISDCLPYCLFCFKQSFKQWVYLKKFSNTKSRQQWNVYDISLFAGNFSSIGALLLTPSFTLCRTWSVGCQQNMWFCSPNSLLCTVWVQ